MNRKYYGYRIVNGEAHINADEAKALQVLYEAYIETGSLSQSGKRAGITITHSCLSRLLENRIFLGTDYYPQIIDEETFSKVQELRRDAIKKRRRKKPEPKEAVMTWFEIDPVDKKYDDPYRQAEYAYGLIEEKTDE